MDSFLTPGKAPPAGPGLARLGLLISTKDRFRKNIVKRELITNTIRNVDRILVFHQGELVEDGTHEELMENKFISINLNQTVNRFQLEEMKMVQVEHY